MPSREVRRIQAKKAATVSENLEKRKTRHPFIFVGTVILLIVVVVTFVASPIARSITGASHVVFGTYEGREIAFENNSGNDFAKEIKNAESALQSSAESQDSESFLYSVWFQAYQQTSMNTAIDVELQKAGTAVSDDSVDTAVLQLPQFSSNGKFSERLYNAATPSEKSNAKKAVREELLRNIWRYDIITGMKTPDAEKTFVASMGMSQRSFQFAPFVFTTYPAAEVKKYAAANESKFRKIKVSRIYVKTSESEAKELLKKITDKSSTFEDLAKTYSSDSYASSGGDMGWRYAYDLESDFDNKEQVQDIMALKAGELSSVIKGTYGWMFFRCTSEAVNADLADSATLDEIKSFILRYEKGKIEDYFNEAAGKLARRSGEIGFAAAAKEAGVTVSTTAYFPINLQSAIPTDTVKTVPDSDELTLAISSEDFFYRGFALGKNQASPPIVLDDRILVLYLQGERQAPAETAKNLADLADSVAYQSYTRSDLNQELTNPSKLKDNFSDFVGFIDLIAKARRTQ
jgi:peptidyl-prolyl cis-trans isomerase D